MSTTFVTSFSWKLLKLRSLGLFSALSLSVADARLLLDSSFDVSPVTFSLLSFDAVFSSAVRSLSVAFVLPSLDVRGCGSF